jgi:hypothetical protein
VTLVFNAEDVVEKITVDAFKRNASREERSSWLSANPLGETRRLAEDYSENARIRILGHADRYKTKMPEGPSLWRRSVQYPSAKPVRCGFYYNRLGLILHAELTGEFITADPVGGRIEALTFEFVQPQPASK